MAGVAVLAATVRGGKRFAEDLAISGAVVVTPATADRIRGLRLSAVIESSEFENLSATQRNRVRETVAPCLCATGGPWFAASEIR